MKATVRFIIASAIGLLVSGCGTYTPDFVLQNSPNATAYLVNDIIQEVKCELREGFLNRIDYDLRNALQQPDRRRRLEWLEAWGAKVTLNLTVNEKTDVAPGLSRNVLLGGSSIFNLGLGVNGTTESTRVATVTLFLDFADFLKRRREHPNWPVICDRNKGMMIEGNLKLDEIITELTFPLLQPENVADRPPETISSVVTFALTLGASATPRWQLFRVTYNPPGASFLSAKRTRTNQVVVTLGPVAKGGTASTLLSQAHTEALIRSGFLDALLVTQRPAF